jgi:cell volume regulation protein A
MGGLKGELKELPVPSSSQIAGKAIVELGLPADFLIILIARVNDFVIPSGGTVLQGGDSLLVLSDHASFDRVRANLILQENAVAGQ